MIRDKIRKAASEIEELPGYEQRLKVEEFQENSMMFIDAMIEASKSIPGYSESHYRVIGELTWKEARVRLCPLWPFC